MTILGKHTIAEVRELALMIESRIKATDALIVQHSNIPPTLLARWEVWRGKWRKTSNEVLPLVTVLSTGNPLVPASAIACEDQYQKLKCAINRSCDDTHADPNDMMSLILEIQTAAGAPIDESNRPQPSASDPDLAALQKLDSAIKAGEAAAKTAQATVATKVPWYVWAGGAVLGLGVVGIYVAPFLPRPQRD